ncbi:MAG: N-glycosylase/DNA lyase [Candidatus ainarchaeum sp.]|nr:N-glycosylase/DNA lyase [Candidatus ainarchaeum sp.]
MRNLVLEIDKLRKSGVGAEARKRMRELKRNFSSEEKLFSELCFCILTANERAAKGIEIQEKIGNGFLTFSENKLRDFLKNNGYRFYNVRAGYIVGARRHFGKLKKTLAKLETDEERREWLVENVKGLGWKEASHFLRNVGFNNCAILDRHIIKTMHENRMMHGEPKTLNEKMYKKYEKKLGTLCAELRMEQGELDFYLWFMKTGKILK